MKSSTPDTTASLRGRTIVMSGGSRGIGLSILVAAARHGANAVLLAKTDQPDPRLPGTVHTAVEEIKAAGGDAVAVVGDVRKPEDVDRVVATAVETYGGIDVCINNASAINLAGTEELSRKQFDLMQDVNVRGTFLLTQACIPHLRQSDRGHILTLSPPLNMAPSWLGRHPAYTMTKYGMSVMTLGWAAELAEAGVAANCLWPQTTIATSAVLNLFPERAAKARRAEIMADAAALVISGDPRERTGQALLDVDVLEAAGVTDLSQYGGSDELQLDLYVDPR